MNLQEEYKKRKSMTQVVVKSNELIQQKRYSLTATQQKFLAFVLSKRKPNDDINTMYEISVDEFCSAIGIKTEWFYKEFIRMIDKFDNDAFWVDTKEELYKFRWFTDTIYQKGSGKVQLYFSRSLERYITGLFKNFTEYELYNVIALKSKYAIRLFELFKSYSYQNTKTFDIDDIKRLLYAEHYTNYKDFRLRVLEPAISEINKYTELSVNYTAETRGKKVISITFIINIKGGKDRFISYQNTIDRVNELNHQVKGQLSIEDYD